MVGVTGLEPATSRPPDVRATSLRYTPTRIVKLTKSERRVKDLKKNSQVFSSLPVEKKQPLDHQ